MNVCRATLSDAPTLVRLAHEAYRHYIARIGRPPAPMLADFTRHITDDAVFIATNDVFSVMWCFAMTKLVGGLIISPLRHQVRGRVLWRHYSGIANSSWKKEGQCLNSSTQMN